MSEVYKITNMLVTDEDIKHIDKNWQSIIDEYTKTLVREKDLVIAQYLMKKQKEEIERLNNVISELEEEYINYMDKQDFAKKCKISRPYLDKLLKVMNRKEIYEFCKQRNKIKRTKRK